MTYDVINYDSFSTKKDGLIQLEQTNTKDESSTTSTKNRQILFSTKCSSQFRPETNNKGSKLMKMAIEKWISS